MSAPVTPGGPNRKLLIGAGVGCGCLSLIVGIVAIILIVSSLGRTQGQPVQPQPQPQPVQPQPVQPQPGPQPQPVGQEEGIDGLKIRMVMVKVQGEANNARPGAPSDTFAAGDTAGALGTFVEVLGAHELHVVWVKIEGEKPSLVAQPHVFRVGDDLQGKPFFFRIGGLVPGDFAFAILKSTGPQQFVRIGGRRFRVQ